MKIVDVEAISELAWKDADLENAQRTVWIESVDNGFVDDSAYGYSCIVNDSLCLCGGRKAFMVTAARLATLAAPEAVSIDWYPYLRHPDTDSRGDKCVNLFRDTFHECEQKQIPATSFFWEVLQYHGQYPKFVDEAEMHTGVPDNGPYAGIWRDLWISEQIAYEALTKHKCPWVMQVVRLGGDFAWLVVTSRAALWLAMKCLEFAQEIETRGAIVDRLRSDLALVNLALPQREMVHRSDNEARCLSALVKQLTEYRGRLTN